MNSYSILSQDNISITLKLSIWKTYFHSKLIYPLIVLCLMNKSSARKISSQISMSIKKCLGLHQSLSKEKLYAWLYELTPTERAEIFLLKTLKKLKKMNHRIRNESYFLNSIKSCEKDVIEKYMSDKININEIKESIMEKRAKEAGISNGKPFETICSNDLDWIRFTTKELDIYRWKGTTCSRCNKYLSTEHLKICVGMTKEREQIKLKTGIEASKILEDPSILNKRKKSEAKSLKSFVAGRISKMIHSAGRSVIG